MANKSVIKHSAAVQITNKINLLQRRAWNILLANAYNELPSNKKYFEVNVRDLMNVLGLKKSENIVYIKEMVEALMNCVIKWNVLGKDKKNIWRAHTLISGVELKEGEGILKYSYDPMLRDLLYNPRIYAKISLSMQNKFNSKHALALYELSVDYFMVKKNVGETPTIELEEFRELMGILQGQYESFKDLNKFVIKPAIKEINKKSDLWAELKYIKTGRKVTALKIFIKPNPNNKNPLINETIQKINTKSIPIEIQAQVIESEIKKESPQEETENFKKLTSYFCLSQGQAKNVIKDYKEEHIQNCLNYVEEKYKKGEIKNIASYTLEVLKHENINIKSQFDTEIQEQQKEKKLLEAKKGFMESLEREYSIYTQKEVIRFKETLSDAKLETLRNEVRQELEEKHRDDKFKDMLFDSYLRSKLKNLAGIPSLEEWQKIRIEEFEKKYNSSVSN